MPHAELSSCLGRTFSPVLYLPVQDSDINLILTSDNITAIMLAVSAQRRRVIILAPIALLMLHLWVKAHILRLRPSALSTDPCDAVNIAGFATYLIAAVWAVVLLVRKRSSPARDINAWRTSQAVILAVFVTVAAQFIALLRNLPLLHPQQRSIFTLLSLEALAVVVAQACLLPARNLTIHRTRHLAITLSILGPLFVLTVSPEWAVDGNTLLRHLLTVLLGFCALLLPVHSVPLLLTGEKPGLRSTFEWLAFALGLLLVLAGFWHLGHTPNTPRTAFLLNFAGLLAMTIAELARPLGMVPSDEPS